MKCWPATHAHDQGLIERRMRSLAAASSLWIAETLYVACAPSTARCHVIVENPQGSEWCLGSGDGLSNRLNLLGVSIQEPLKKHLAVINDAALKILKR